MPKFLAVPSIIEPDLVLPLVGADGVEREYHIPPATAEQFITLQAVKIQQDGGSVVGADEARLAKIDDLEKLWALTFGEACLKKMLADGVSGPDFQRASRTAYQWHITGGDDAAAEVVWSGKARSPTSGQTLSAGGGDEAATTSEPASTPGTSTHRATNRRKRPPTSDGTNSGSTST